MLRKDVLVDECPLGYHPVFRDCVLMGYAPNSDDYPIDQIVWYRPFYERRFGKTRMRFAKVEDLS